VKVEGENSGGSGVGLVETVDVDAWISELTLEIVEGEG